MFGISVSSEMLRGPSDKKGTADVSDAPFSGSFLAKKES